MNIVEEKPSNTEEFSVCVYKRACQRLKLIPASYYIRHALDDTLIMKHYGLGCQGARALAIALVSNSSVSHLDLQGNWIETKGCIYITQMLCENEFITYLNLADNRIGNEGAVAICDFLVKNIVLQYLNLSGNLLQDACAPKFVAALEENAVLKELILSHNKFSEKSGKHFGNALGMYISLLH